MILDESNFNFRYGRLCDLDIPREKMVKLFAKYAASDQGLHCLPITLLGPPGCNALI